MPPSSLRNFGANLGFKHAFKSQPNLYGEDASGGDDDDKNNDPNFVQILSGLMTFSTGIFLTAVRLWEPLIRVLLWEFMYAFFGEVYDPDLGDASGTEELIR